jgi:hypothetical protein
MVSITTHQLIEDLIAIPAFIPITVCTGYLAAWTTNLFGFRARSLVERFFWSVPLSISVSTIGCVLLGMFGSLTLASALLVLSAAVSLAILTYEGLQLRRKGQAWHLGIQPLGGTAIVLVFLWMAIIVVSLIDIQGDQKLSMSLTVYDHAQRVNWAESILRTGIPPANPFYFFQHPAPLRYYYFWLADCAAVAKYSRLPMRSILAAGCVWSAIALASIVGLFLKHFLEVGERLRRQFVIALGLFAVTGLASLVDLWNMLVLHLTFPGESWSLGQLQDWLSFFLLYPHHLIAAICCLFALLLASISSRRQTHSATSAIWIAAALASSFGLSVYVAFAFFLVVILWAIWQLSVEHRLRASLILAAGGIAALVLLIPYLRSLTHSESKVASGGSIFVPWVREMIPPDSLLGTGPFRHLGLLHPRIAHALAKLVLLIPGYAIELGFYFIVLFVFLVPAWRGRSRLTEAQRTLVVLAVATLPVTSFLRSAVLTVNDFGMHSALFLQIPLLLLASELAMSWYSEKRERGSAALYPGLPHSIPTWLYHIANLAIVFGVATTVYKAFNMRVSLPILEANFPAAKNWQVPELSRKAYIAQEGYAALDTAIPRNAIIQFNPAATISWWESADFLGVHHQIVTASDQLWCGSELGGDPKGCPAIAAAVHSLYNDASGSQARAICSQYGMQYLVAYVYDPAWKDPQSWVWTLPSIVAQPKFRALDCRP